MAKSAADLIASIKGAGGIDGLCSLLGGSKALKDPFRERMKRLAAIPERYGPHKDKWPAKVKEEYEFLCMERDSYNAFQDEQLKFEAKKRL